MILEVRHLRVVEAISREGTVSRAAERLHITQSAASHTLRDLEDRLGVRLFHRERVRMRPTPEGRRLLETADRVLSEILKAERELEALKQGGMVCLRIATQCYTCYSWLPAILGSFQSDFPGVELRIVPEATDDPVEALVSDRVDLVILHRRAGRDDVVEESLFHDELVALFPCHHELASRPWLEPADLAGEHLILHNNPEESSVVTEFLGPAGVKPGRISQLRLTEAVVEAVRSGLGMTVLARWVAESQMQRGGLKAVRLQREGLYRTWTVGLRRNQERDPALRELIRLIRENTRPPRV